MAKYGKTWWGSEWLKSLNNIDYSNRLGRGSAYASNGSVLEIDINENRVVAKVKGSRPKPYNVDIIIPPFFDQELAKFVNALADRPTIISKLLNRELDPEVLEIAQSHKLKVFPTQWSDLKMQCSCPDWAVPCKHLAAVIYKLSVEIDNNPFLVFELHKVNLIGELKAKGMEVSTSDTAIMHIIDHYFTDSEIELPDFDDQKAFTRVNYAKLQPIFDPLLSLLQERPAFYTETTNFKEKYRSILGKFVKHCVSILEGKIALEMFFERDLKADITIHKDDSVQFILNDHLQLFAEIGDTVLDAADYFSIVTKIPAYKLNEYAPSVAFSHTILMSAIHLIANGGIIPQIAEGQEGQFIIRWLPAMIHADIRDLVQRISSITPPDILLWDDGDYRYYVQKDKGLNLIAAFITSMVKKGTHIIDDKIVSLFFREQSSAFDKPGEASLKGGIHVWLQKYYLTLGRFSPQIVIDDTVADQFKVTIGIKGLDKEKQKVLPLTSLLTNDTYANERYKVLQSITQLSHLIPGLDANINSRGVKAIILDNSQFTSFLLDIIPAIRMLDIEVLLPKGLQQLLKPKPSIKLKQKESTGRSFLKLEDMLSFDWQVAIGDDMVTYADFKKLIATAGSLIKYKNNYIYVDQDEMAKIHKAITSAQHISPLRLLQSALSGEYRNAPITMTDEVSLMIKELTSLADIDLPVGLNAQLRPYQLRGYSWMYRNAKIGFGSVIADDMGLGKTLQVITKILKYKNEGCLDKDKVLVVVPTGLLTNWGKEIEKFAPSLSTHTYHGPFRKLADAKDKDVVLTSYGIARSDAKLLKDKNWFLLIIDEAQNIKNTKTEQTKAIKSIHAQHFIAMSGTPVENRLSELWSIFDFANSGLLGSSKEFNDDFGIPIEKYNNLEVANKLKKISAPFMMRRLKSDKSIISDLPDKIELDTYVTLTTEQASLYQITLEKALQVIEGISEADSKSLFKRQGLVLQMILSLKQICNHPTQFLKNKVFDDTLSGKMELLYERLDTIIENNEKVLIFTQFTEMGQMLKSFIHDKYGDEPLYYHGGCSIKQRNQMVDLFQNHRSNNVFILSLKAAGTGLNLTSANHVIHYDLWWNPAVEAQATDRAYRIGQKSNVMVHRFITRNTFEERINDMIQSKKALANMTVSTGENWIGNLSNKELKDLFALAE